MRKSLAIPAIAALALCGPAMSANLSYNMLELGILDDSIDDPDGGNSGLDGSGMSIGGSWAISRSVFGFANLSGMDYEYRDTDDSDFTAGRFQLGIGFNVPLSRNIDLVSGLSLERLRLEDDANYTLNDDGYGLKVGLRGLAGDRFEWTAGLNYVDMGHGNDDTSWTAGFRYYFTRRFAAGVDVGSTDKNQRNWLVGFRWDFGDRR